MKICPKCKSKYTDVTLVYCLQDGAALEEAADEKTLVLGPDSFADEATIAESGSENAPDRCESVPKTEIVSANTADNRSVETVLGNRQTSDVTDGSVPIARGKHGGIGFALGFLLAFVTLGIIGVGIYAGWQFSNSSAVLSNQNSNTNESGSGKTRTISNSKDVKVTASTVREPDKGNTYNPELAFDGNPRTAWCEGVKGAGRKQWIVFDFNKEVKLKEIVIQPGYFKTREIWRNNNRVSSVVVEFSDKTTRNFNFPDMMEEQRLTVGGISTSSVFIAIKDIYPGSADSEDTLISEVSFVVE